LQHARVTRVRQFNSGVYLVTGLGDVAELRALGIGVLLELDPAQTAVARAVALGRPVKGTLAHTRVVTRREADPAFVTALQRLGRDHTWRMAGVDDGEKHAAALRRLRARHRLVEDPWDASHPLAECAVARVAPLVRPGQTVAVFGTVDTAVAAALRGARVTWWTNTPAPLGLRVAVKRWEDHGPVKHDVVLVDVPGHAGAAAVALLRACHAVRVGGVVGAVVALREEAVAAAGRLPLRLDRVLQDHTAVVLPGGHVAPERLDQLVWKRISGVAPAEATAELRADVPGAPTTAHQAHVDLVVTGCTAEVLLHAAQRAWTACGAVTLDVRETTTNSHVHLAVAFAGGGHLALVLERSTGKVALDLLPFHDGLATALTHHLMARAAV
jgi:hypothetical protein